MVFPVFVGSPKDAADVRATRIVDECIDAVEFFCGSIYESLDVVELCHIRLDRENIRFGLSLKLIRGKLEESLIARADCQPRSVDRHRVCYCLADAFARTGDKDNFTLYAG